MRGGGISSKLEKSAAFTFHLRIHLGKLYVVGASGVHQRFCGQKSDPDMQFGCMTEKSVLYSGLLL